MQSNPAISNAQGKQKLVRYCGDSLYSLFDIAEFDCICKRDDILRNQFCAVNSGVNITKSFFGSVCFLHQLRRTTTAYPNPVNCLVFEIKLF